MKHLLVAIAAVLAAGTSQAAELFAFGSSGPADDNGLTVDGGTKIAFFDTGWYRNTGDHSIDNQNYIAGFCENCGGYYYNNWFVVDISGLSAPVSSLSLTLFSYDVTTTGTYTLNDYGGSITTLVDGTGGTAAYADLGTGTSFGSISYTPGDSNLYRTISLNDSAVASLNQAIAAGDDYWALGGSFAAQPVPEPSSYALLLAGLGAVGWAARRRRA